MFEKILCPTDFSENSIKALQWAERLTQKFQSELVIVHVLSIPQPGFASAFNFEAYREKAVSALTSFVSALRVKHETVMSIGEPARAILQISRNLKSTGIVMGTRGVKGAIHKILGSTTENVIRESEIPVLTISPECVVPDDFNHKRILLPISSLDTAIPGNVRFRKIIREMKASVRLFHVVDMKDPMFRVFLCSAPFQLLDCEMNNRKHQLQNLGAALSSTFTDIDVDPLIQFGEVPDEILGEIKAHPYDAVLMCVKEQTLISRFLESIAYKVISGSSIPVITIRTTRK